MSPAADAQIVLISDEYCSMLQTKLAWSNPERRRLYLLRADVDVPISGDPRVTTRTATPEEKSWRIIVTVHEEDQEGLAKSEIDDSFGSFEVVDSKYLDGAYFLGFDVCDRDLYSSLLNCGYMDDLQRKKAKKRWGTRLTEHHLLRNLTDAKTIRNLADIRVAAHAPFFVLRMFRGPDSRISAQETLL